MWPGWKGYLITHVCHADHGVKIVPSVKWNLYFHWPPTFSIKTLAQLTIETDYLCFKDLADGTRQPHFRRLRCIVIFVSSKVAPLHSLSYLDANNTKRSCIVVSFHYYNEESLLEEKIYNSTIWQSDFDTSFSSGIQKSQFQKILICGCCGLWYWQADIFKFYFCQPCILN